MGPEVLPLLLEAVDLLAVLVVEATGLVVWALLDLEAKLMAWMGLDGTPPGS